MTNNIKWFSSIIAGILTSFLGGWDIWLSTLIFFVISDIIVGLIKAILMKSEKTKSGGLSSTVMFKGGLKKILIFFVVVVASRVDLIISPNSTLIRSMAIGYYVATEGLSITENIAACGVPLPKKLIKILENLKSDNDIEGVD